MAARIDLTPLSIEVAKEDSGVRDLSETKQANEPKPDKDAVNLKVFTYHNETVIQLQRQDRHVTSGIVIDLVLKELNLQDASLKGVFGLWMVSKSFELQLKATHQPVQLYKCWNKFLMQYTKLSKEQCLTEKPKIFLQRNIFLSIEKEKDIVTRQVSDKAINLLYNEAMHKLIKGFYPPLKKADVTELGGYQCAIDSLTSHNTVTMETIKERITDYYPPSINMALTDDQVRRKSLPQLKTSGIDKDLYDMYQSCLSTTDTDIQLMCKYLEKCWTMPYYGCIRFPGLIERKMTSSIMSVIVYRDRQVTVAINPRYIYVFSDPSNEVLLQLKMSHDLSCEYQPATEEGKDFYASLWLMFDTSFEEKGHSKRFQIFSKQASLMGAMINRCLCEQKDGGDVVSCSQSLKPFVCETYIRDPDTGEKVRMKPLGSLKRSLLKTTLTHKPPVST